MAKRTERTRWVSYLRVSTVGQAEKELSPTAQRRLAEELAARHNAVIDHHYGEPGASGTDPHRAVFIYPGGLTPYDFCKVPVEVQAGKKPRYRLAIEPAEAEILRTMYRLYLA